MNFYGSLSDLKIPARDKTNPKKYNKPSTPDPVICRRAHRSMGVFRPNVEVCDGNLELALCLSKTQNDQLVHTRLQLFKQFQLNR